MQHQTHPKDKDAHRFFEHGVHVKATTTIMRGAPDLYKAWRHLEDLPRFIDSLKSVHPVNPTTSRWTAKGPGGKDVSWEADVINDEPNRRIAWKTREGSTVASAGTIEFKELPHDRGTKVDVTLEYLPPAGVVGKAVAMATGTDAKTQVRQALHRFRQVMETGEVAQAKGGPVGEGSQEHETRETDGDVRDIAGTEKA